MNQLGIAHTPHLAAHPLPQRIAEHIQRVNKSAEPLQLAQVLRLQRTNIRAADHHLLSYQEKKTHLDPERLAELDAQFVQTQMQLAQGGKMLAFLGSFPHNRFLDGLFTDLENYSIKSLNADSVMRMIEELVEGTSEEILLISQLETYEKNFAQMTGYKPHLLYFLAKQLREFSSPQKKA